MRGSVESSCGDHRTHQHTVERDQSKERDNVVYWKTNRKIINDLQSKDTMAAHNHFHQVQGAQRRVQCILENKNGTCPMMEGQVHLSSDTQYVRALGMIREGDDQPVKNRKMRSLTQKGNQAKFFHRMLGIQRSPAVHNLQHLREYKSCRIWASQSGRLP